MHAQAVAHFTQRSLSAALLSWREAAARSAQHRQLLNLAAARWRGAALSLAFAAWADSAREQAWASQAAEAALQQWRLSAVAQAWRCWVEAAAEQWEQRRKACRMQSPLPPAGVAALHCPAFL